MWKLRQFVKDAFTVKLEEKKGDKQWENCIKLCPLLVIAETTEKPVRMPAFTNTGKKVSS